MKAKIFKAGEKGKEATVVFGPCRLSYTHLFNKYAPDGDQSAGKYMTNVLIQKEDKDVVKAINAAVEAAKKAAIVSKWGGKEPKKLDLPLRDGDEKEDEVYEGCYYLNAKCSTRPGIVDRDREPITDEDEIYSGVYAVVSVTFFGYDVSGNRGIACGLNNVMKAKDGERLGGRVSADTEFNGVEFDDEDDDL